LPALESETTSGYNSSMIIGVLLLAAGTAFAAPSPKEAERPPEETLRIMLYNLRQHYVWEVRQVVLGAADELRDAVAAGTGTAKGQFAERLPGMAKDPFDICRDLQGCPAAPLSLHVEETAVIDEAFVAMARPWFKLQKARGKAVSLTVDPGVGVRLNLEDFPQRPVVTLVATPTPTGGFDITMNEGSEAVQAYAAERSVVLRGAKN
jgi:hypothetical protein